MNPLTHLLVGWTVAQTAELSRRERGLVTLAGVAPDLDGLGIVADLVAGRHPAAGAYAAYHHVLTHNLATAALMALLAFALARRRWVCAGLCFVSFHLHLLGDLVGSAGPGGSIWTLAYLYPFSERAFAWQGQWELNAWPNLLTTAVLLAFALWIGIRRGRTPVELVSPRTDAALVAALRARLRRARGAASPPGANRRV